MSDDLGAIVEIGGATAVEMAASALAARGQKSVQCHNCGSPTFAAYCAVCGQERETHRHSVWSLMRDVIQDVASFDSRILRTTMALLVRPGELPLAFHEGRTRRYVPAVRLYLFVSLLFFVTLSLTGIALMQIELKQMPNVYVVKKLPNGRISVTSNGDVSPSMPHAFSAKDKSDALKPGSHQGLTTSVHFFQHIGRFQQKLSPADMAKLAELKTKVLSKVGNDKNGWMARNSIGMLEKLARDPAALNASLVTWIPRAFFLLLPIYAILLAIFYIRQRRQFYFVDHLIFSLAVHTFVFAALIIAIGLAQIMDGGLAAAVIFVAISLYIFLALKRFYGQGWFITSVKFLCISFIYFIFVLVPALALVLTAGFLEG